VPGQERWLKERSLQERSLQERSLQEQARRGLLRNAGKSVRPHRGEHRSGHRSSVCWGLLFRIGASSTRALFVRNEVVYEGSRV
jgi:hypothetical protein